MVLENEWVDGRIGVNEEDFEHMEFDSDLPGEGDLALYNNDNDNELPPAGVSRPWTLVEVMTLSYAIQATMFGVGNTSFDTASNMDIALEDVHNVHAWLQYEASQRQQQRNNNNNSNSDHENDNNHNGVDNNDADNNDADSSPGNSQE